MPKIDYPHLFCKIQPGLASFAMMMLGFILLALSFVFGVGQVPVKLTTEAGTTLLKEVGYGSAINWSLTLTLVLPAALLYLCKIYQAFPAVLRDLAANRMVVTAELAPIPGGWLVSCRGKEIFDAVSPMTRRLSCSYSSVEERPFPTSGIRMLQSEPS